jgi:small subunit ribosomal protein S17
MPRRILKGTVVSDKASKTIVVKVERTTKHPVYGKILRTQAKFHAHDEQEQAKLGDTVEVIECAPKSRLKHFELHRVVLAVGTLVTDTASDVVA